MVNRAASTFDLTNQADVARVLPQAPLIDSYDAGWQGLTFTHYCHPPHETVEHCLLQHSLVIMDAKSRFQAERRWDGKLRHYDHGNGRVDVVPALLNHQTNWDREIEFSVLAICPTLLNRASEQREVALMPQVAVVDTVIQQLALALKLEIQTGCLSGRLYGESLGTALAARLVHNYAVSRPKFKTGGLSQAQLAQVIGYMQANLAEDMSILDLATLAGMSESHFSRCFKRSVGVSPYRYLMQQRVERAKRLLERQSMPISAVALECGFANQTHLTKVFRQMTGVTPKAYQKK
ncbi:MAG: AraC family transcriptional regulator [Cyanobacteria bacterium J06648_16]